MLNSMTGFGLSKDEFDFGTVEISIQSVNHRYFNVRCYINEKFQKYQLQIEKELKTRLLRGSVTVSIKITLSNEKQTPNLDKTLVKSYLSQVADLMSEINPDPENFLISQHNESDGFLQDGRIYIEPKITISDILNLPNIFIQTDNSEDDEKSLKMIMQTLNKAVIETIKMRSEEGLVIAKEFETRLECIRISIDKIEARKNEIFEIHHQKLKNRINEVLASLNLQIEDADIAKEIAISAERSDISEEISRLRHHINQFSITLNENGESGRKLDFIAQEMLREANTIASKSSSAEINTHIVEVKTEIDKIKEQVQNIL